MGHISRKQMQTILNKRIFRQPFVIKSQCFDKKYQREYMQKANTEFLCIYTKNFARSDRIENLFDDILYQSSLGSLW